jgi:hypothetical protein
MFTNEQIKSAARWILTLLGGLVGGWVAKSGFISADQVASFFTSETVVGLLTTGIASGIALVWSMITHTDKNAVAVVDTLAKQPDSPVKAVLMEPTPAGQAMAASIPGNTTVVAGSTPAINMAKAA